MAKRCAVTGKQPGYGKRVAHSGAGTGHTYVTTKNRKNDPDRLRLRKFDPVARRHVQYREQR